ncbi:hemagglutinin repeat-containing protein, partial [Sulfurimonas sp.]|uniref:hemagglutinin repeat-containing protein n=1 Tax=Sulfurimonas sp. TaxID=2022749 RepID=UPI0025F8B79D
INTKEKTTIKGATLNANDSLTIDTKNLEVASVQDSSKTRSNSVGVSAGFGASGLSSLGANTSNANSKSKQTVLTSLTGNKVDITTEQETKLKGAIIAAVDKVNGEAREGALGYADGKDNGQLNLKTDTLLASSLNNTQTSKSTSVGINVGGAVQDAKISNVGIDFSSDSTNAKTKTLATLGSGNIQIGNEEDSDTKMLNTDIANNEVDIYNVSSHKGLKGELDTRMLSEDGRNQIAQDLLKSGMIVDTITQIVTNETVGVSDFFSNTAKEHTTYEAIKEEIANDPALAKALSNPDLTPEQKEQMMDDVTDTVMKKLGYETHDNKLIATDEKGRDNKDIKGYHSLETKDSYINEKNIENGNEGLIQVAGTEAQRSIDRQEGSTFDQSQSYRDDRSDFSQNIGENIASYTNFALSSTGQSSMTNYNKGRVTTTPSIFNTVAANNAEFAGLDKSQGDNMFFIPFVLSWIGFEDDAHAPIDDRKIPDSYEDAKETGKKIIKSIKEDPKKFAKKLGEAGVVADAAAAVGMASKNVKKTTILATIGGWFGAMSEVFSPSSSEDFAQDRQIDKALDLVQEPYRTTGKILIKESKKAINK